MHGVLPALSVGLALLFVATGGLKVLHLPAGLAVRDHLRVTPGLWPVIGTLETAGGIGLLAGLVLPALGLAAALGLALLMAGAITVRLRVPGSLPAVCLDVLVLALVITEAVLRWP